MAFQLIVTVAMLACLWTGGDRCLVAIVICLSMKAERKPDCNTVITVVAAFFAVTDLLCVSFRGVTKRLLFSEGIECFSPLSSMSTNKKESSFEDSVY